MLEKLHAELVVPAISGETAVTAPREITNVALICLTDVPQILGADKKKYGPFRGGEVGFLPRWNAEFLIKNGLARKIEVKLS
jgi:DNA replication initiation complex subunit (GINS family)